MDSSCDSPSIYIISFVINLHLVLIDQQFCGDMDPFHPYRCRRQTVWLPPSARVRQDVVADMWGTHSHTDTGGDARASSIQVADNAEPNPILDGTPSVPIPGFKIFCQNILG
jgi:hypothetical protein